MSRLPIIITLLLALAPLTAEAEERDDWYDIELIIFEHKAPPGGAAEAWALDPGAPAFGEAVELAPVAGEAQLLPAAGVRMPYRRLDASNLRLQRLVSRLTASGNYESLLHVAWRQPASSAQPVRSVRVHSGLSGQASEPGPPPGTLFIDTRTVRVPAPRVTPVDGLVSLQRNRFLHVNLDLLLAEPAAETAETGLFSIFSRRESRPQVYRLQAQRRIRVNEVHYFDHPVFGAIVQVRPYEKRD
jgi:hypothetical protein